MQIYDFFLNQQNLFSFLMQLMVKMMVVRYGMKGVLVEMLALLLMVMIEIIIEGEAGGLALGLCRVSIRTC